MATVRLDVPTEAALKRLSMRRGQTKSEVIRDAIAHLVDEEERQPSAYDLLRPFIGIVEDDNPRLSEETGKQLRQLFEDKHRARRSR